MKANRNTKARRIAIVAHLQQCGRASVDDLALQFDTTPQTIRKDLTVLADDGKVMRFHGGASLLGGTEYVSYDVRREIAPSEKEQIGKAVAREIPNNAAVFLNAGTTVAAVARHLENHAGLRVVTDNVSLANDIRAFPGLEVYVPGGTVRGSDGAILGEIAVDFIRQFRADVAVIGAAAISADGALLDYDLREASVARAMIENARHVILAADSTKFGRLAPVRIGHLQQMRTLVTDRHCPAELAALCRTNQVGLIEAT